MGNIYVLEKKSRAGITSPALDTFIMVGFNDEKDCIDTYRNIASQDSRVRVVTLDKYLEVNTYPRFRDETGRAGVVKKFVDSYTTFPLIDLTANLIKNEVMVIDVIEGDGGEFTYSQDEMTLVRETNEKVKDVLMLGKQYRGSYMYRTHSDASTGLDNFIRKAKDMCPSVRFLVAYINPTILTLMEVENKIYSFTHDSIIVTAEDAMYYLTVENSKMSLSVLDVPQLSYRIR